jgi:hypothetical protein
MLQRRPRILVGLGGPNAELSRALARRLQRQTVSKRNALIDYSTAHDNEKLLCYLGVLYLYGLYPRRQPP